MSEGDPEKLKKGQNTLVNAAIGIGVVLASVLVIIYKDIICDNISDSFSLKHCEILFHRCSNCLLPIVFMQGNVGIKYWIHITIT